MKSILSSIARARASPPSAGWKSYQILIGLRARQTHLATSHDASGGQDGLRAGGGDAAPKQSMPSAQQ